MTAIKGSTAGEKLRERQSSCLQYHRIQNKKNCKDFVGKTSPSFALTYTSEEEFLYSRSELRVHTETY
jgi:hypothetical protein